MDIYESYHSILAASDTIRAVGGALLLGAVTVYVADGVEYLRKVYRRDFQNEQSEPRGGESGLKDK